MAMQKNYRNMITFGALFFTLVFANAAYAGGAMKSGKPLDAQLGLRFTTPLPANVPQGAQVEAIVTSPEKLAGFGLGSVKKGDKVLLIVGPSDSFSVKPRFFHGLLYRTQDGIGFCWIQPAESISFDGTLLPVVIDLACILTAPGPPSQSNRKQAVARGIPCWKELFRHLSFPYFHTSHAGLLLRPSAVSLPLFT